MRYLIDTNIFYYLSIDADSISPDVSSILDDPENLIYISTESVRELIIAFNNKRLCLQSKIAVFYRISTIVPNI